MTLFCRGSWDKWHATCEHRKVILALSAGENTSGVRCPAPYFPGPDRVMQEQAQQRARKMLKELEFLTSRGCRKVIELDYYQLCLVKRQGTLGSN